MKNKSHWITLTAVLIVMALIMTACAQLTGSIDQPTSGGGDSGQGEPAPEQPIEAPPEEEPIEAPPEEEPIEEPAAPAPTQAPAGNTENDTTSQGNQTGVVIVLLLILVIIGVIILIADRGRGSQSQSQTPAADAPATPPTPVDDSETNDFQSG